MSEDAEICGILYAVVQQREKLGPGPFKTLRPMVDLEYTNQTTFLQILEQCLRGHCNVSSFLADNEIEPVRMGNSSTRLTLEEETLRAVKKSNSKQVSKLLNEIGAQADGHIRLNSFLASDILLVACRTGDEAVVRVLLQAGVAVTARDSMTGATCLHLACEMNIPNLVVLLLQHGADATARTKLGRTVLDEARARNNTAMVRLLESHLSSFTGWVDVEQRSSLQAGVGMLLGEGGVISGALQRVAGGNWSKRWVVVINIRGTRAMAATSVSPVKCSGCSATIFPPKMPSLIICGQCRLELRVPADAEGSISELAVYESERSAQPLVSVGPLFDSCIKVTRRGVRTVAGNQRLKFEVSSVSGSEQKRVTLGAPPPRGEECIQSLLAAPSQMAEAARVPVAVATEVCEETSSASDGVTSAVVIQDSWSCGACTFVNEASSEKCDMCATERRGNICATAAELSPPPLPPRPSAEALDKSLTSTSMGNARAAAVPPPLAPAMAGGARARAVPPPPFPTDPQHDDVADDDEIDAFLCPLTLARMVDPVITADGQTYEREAIESWFKRGERSSPLTGAALSTTLLVPNVALRNAIEQSRGQAKHMQAGI